MATETEKPEPTVPYELSIGGKSQPFEFTDGVIPQKNLRMKGDLSQAEALELAAALTGILRKRQAGIQFTSSRHGSATRRKSPWGTTCKRWKPTLRRPSAAL